MEAPFPTHGELAQGLSLTMRPPGQQAPYVFSHRSDQKPGYRQVYVGIFWPILRYVFKNSARYTRCSISKVCFLEISTFLKNTHDRNTYCSLLRDLRAQAQSARHVKREEREKEL